MDKEEKQPEATEAEKKDTPEEETKEEAVAEKEEHTKEEENPVEEEDVNDIPDFERVENHQFQKDEEVYMIDPNGLDLWEGIIEKAEGNKYSIHYPEFPTDDEDVEGTDRVLVRTDKNKEIYNNQEKIRAEKEEEIKKAESKKKKGSK
ncbi:hypothetical protein M9Y10_039094 [Tritrichomonas musculus]|uniref:Uncharacterized protein n=1 Tax=Tritrichomonas musculus TaxID=1915356 RepID=A0ABR2KAC3_9EUKA